MDVYQVITERIIEKLEQGNGTVVQAPAQHRIPTQPRIEEALSRRERMVAHGPEIQLAVFGDYPANQRAWRPCPQRGEKQPRRPLAG
jgi:hypothetical protein